MDTIYAVCPNCAHVEARPSHAEDDWFDCESCDYDQPELCRDLEEAEDLSEEIMEATGADERIALAVFRYWQGI